VGVRRVNLEERSSLEWWPNGDLEGLEDAPAGVGLVADRVGLFLRVK